MLYQILAEGPCVARGKIKKLPGGGGFKNRILGWTRNRIPPNFKILKPAKPLNWIPLFLPGLVHGIIRIGREERYKL